MSIRLNGSTSGYTEIDAPAVAGSNTLVLPTGNGSSGQFLQTNGSGAMSWGNQRILQVVSATYSTEVGTSSSTFSDTGLTASITPSSSSNKILVFVSHGTISKSSPAALNNMGIKLFRGSTEISYWGNALLYTNTATTLSVSASFAYLDSPASTSSVSYKTQFSSLNATTAVFVQNNNSMSSIVLLEVAA
jgi:hypothetical protein